MKLFGDFDTQKNEHIPNIEHIIEHIRNSKLTLLWKCQIINSFNFSKLFYVATILESPDQAIFKQVKKYFLISI